MVQVHYGQHVFKDAVEMPGGSTADAAGNSTTNGNKTVNGNSHVKGTAQFDGMVTVADIIDLAEFTVAQLPDPTGHPGYFAYCSNGAAGNPVLAFSNGTNWLRCDTLATVSAV